MDILTEIARRLAVELGHPEDVDVRTLFPTADLRLAVETAVER